MGQVIQLQNKVEEVQKPKTKTYRKKGVNDVPNAGGHLMVGTAIGLAVAHTPVALACVLFGSLLPDIDHRTSTLGKWNPFTRWMKHRGHAHSLVGSALLSLPFIVFGKWVFLYVFLGCFGHLLADRFMSLFPKKQKFRIHLW